MSYINNSLHLARKYARIFVRGDYLFRVAHSFPPATLSLQGTDNVPGQIPELISQEIVTLSKYGHEALDICHP